MDLIYARYKLESRPPERTLLYPYLPSEFHLKCTLIELLGAVRQMQAGWIVGLSVHSEGLALTSSSYRCQQSTD